MAARHTFVFINEVRARLVYIFCGRERLLRLHKSGGVGGGGGGGGGGCTFNLSCAQTVRYFCRQFNAKTAPCRHWVGGERFQ